MGTTDTSAKIRKDPAGRGTNRAMKKIDVGTAAEEALSHLRRLQVDESAAALRNAAEALVTLRQLFDYKGMRDWTGRSNGYRDIVENLYRQAEIPPDSERPLQSKLRYHVGNVLRESAPQAELEELGLSSSGPSERAADKRAKGGSPRRRPAEVTRTRIDSPMAVAAMVLDGVKLLRAMDIQGEDRDIVEGLVRRTLDECLAFLKD